MSLSRANLIMLVASLGALAATAVEVAPFDSGNRVKLALSHYAEALEESDRDSRLAMFARAEQGFASVIERGSRNAALLTNLGNAALQAGHRGQAVLAYKQALLLDAEAMTARQNLWHVRTLLPSWVPRPSSTEGTQALLFYRRVSPALRSYLAAGCFVAAAISLAIHVRRRDGAWRGVAVIGGLAWVILLASIVFDSGLSQVGAAVIMNDDTIARSADSRLAAQALPEGLPAGTEVEVLENRAEWARIRLHNGRDVWVRGSSLSRVAK